MVPRGVKAVSILMAAATLIAAAAAVTLLLPGTPLDRIWTFKPAAYQQMLSFRWLAGAGLAALAAASFGAAIGLWRGRWWGLVVAVAVLGVNGVSDLGRAFSGDPAGGLLGVVIAAALIAYLIRRDIRARFR